MPDLVFDECYRPNADVAKVCSVTLDLARRGIEYDGGDPAYCSDLVGLEIRDPDTAASLGRAELFVYRWKSTPHEQLVTALETILQRLKTDDTQGRIGWTARNQAWGEGE